MSQRVEAMEEQRAKHKGRALAFTLACTAVVAVYSVFLALMATHMPHTLAEDPGVTGMWSGEVKMEWDNLVIEHTSDLSKGNVDWEVTEGADFALDFEFENFGEVAISSSTLTILVEGEVWESLGTGPMEANGSIHIQRTINASTPGEATISIILDSNGEIRESNDENNIITVDYLVVSLDDPNGGNPENQTVWFWPLILLLILGCTTVIIISIWKGNTR